MIPNYREVEGRRESRRKEGLGVEVRKEKNSKAFHEDDGGRKEKSQLIAFQNFKAPSCGIFSIIFNNSHFNF